MIDIKLGGNHGDVSYCGNIREFATEIGVAVHTIYKTLCENNPENGETFKQIIQKQINHPDGVFANDFCNTFFGQSETISFNLSQKQKGDSHRD